MLQTLLVVLSVACGGTAVGDGGAKSASPPAIKGGEAKASGARQNGHVVSVSGPCRGKPCCKPISLLLPNKLEPKSFSPRMAIKLIVAPGGQVTKVEITKSSGIPDVDRQLREGARGWCMEKTREGREVDFMINLDVR